VEIVELKAEDRSTTGKNKARQLRAQGKLPVNLYGHKAEAASLAVNTRDFERIVRAHAGAKFVMKLVMDNQDDASVIVKEIQRHPTRDDLLHVDLLRVDLDEKILTAVPLHIVGDSIGVREGGVLQSGIRDLQIEVSPADLPDFIEVDVTDLGAGQTIHASDVVLPSTMRLVGLEDEVIATILAAAKLEAAPGEEEAGVQTVKEEAAEGAEES
jgi:large subunit ribosomal protein L25